MCIETVCTWVSVFTPTTFSCQFCRYVATCLMTPLVCLLLPLPPSSESEDTEECCECPKNRLWLLRALSFACIFSVVPVIVCHRLFELCHFHDLLHWHNQSFVRSVSLSAINSTSSCGDPTILLSSAPLLPGYSLAVLLCLLPWYSLFHCCSRTLSKRTWEPWGH